MRTLFLTSNGLNEKTTSLFWKYVGKEPIDTKAILVPSAAAENDGAREGIIVCMERLMNMGISVNNILIYDLALLLSDGYKRTYSSYVRDIPAQLRLMNALELAQYDVIAFCGGNARTLLDEVNRTGLSEPLKQAIEKGLVYLGISAGSMIAAGNFADSLGYLANPLTPHAEKGSPCGEISKEGLIELADGQTILIKGECQEIIC
ncbi:MAG TPA: Type 1 glutamine amidotransferase-like domain-containing protein [Candidatus Blautia stercoripullorum]|uniref:Type 1 glutamine amidotransferase-like domain-containing protein n=1 Tax=Candidatus Blautia stercoripullorum TaxID=2838502 RepID=A0A9D2R9V0_9FIRM|nr:Type 1 glutamine amidotransferase-like domain-containing protein [Candidatus Blautia stercoripullorum]